MCATRLAHGSVQKCLLIIMCYVTPVTYDHLCSIRRPGDSGQGESDSEHDSSDDTDNDELTSHELIKWKKGRLIGKGAFGKVVMAGLNHMIISLLLQVWEGLMESAKLIAVKEVELDTENDEKAKQVTIMLS